MTEYISTWEHQAQAQEIWLGTISAIGQRETPALKDTKHNNSHTNKNRCRKILLYNIKLSWEIGNQLIHHKLKCKWAAVKFSHAHKHYGDNRSQNEHMQYGYFNKRLQADDEPEKSYQGLIVHEKLSWNGDCSS